MEEHFIQIAAIISVVILAAIAVYQILLFAGIPWGEYSWGGKHKGVLPQPYRMLSLPAAILLFVMVFVLLVHTKLLSVGSSIFSAHFLVWIITSYLGLNTMGNLASRSRKEKLIMTPLSGLSFVMCLIIAIFA